MKIASKIIVSAVCILFLLAACSNLFGPVPLAGYQGAENSPGYVPSAGTVDANSPGFSSTETPGAEPESPVSEPSQDASQSSTLFPPKYSMNVILNFDDHQLAVDETINYQNETGSLLFELVLAIEPNLQSGCFSHVKLMVDDYEAVYSLDGNRLVIPLAVPLQPGGMVDLSIRFILKLPVVNSLHLFGYNYFETTLVDWYPYIVPYKGGWLLHPQSEVGESLVYDLADFDVTITLAEPNDQILIAAGAPSDANSDEWHFSLEHARSFAFIVSPYFKVASMQVGETLITSYFFKDEALQGQVVLNETGKALETFTSLFGAYPYQSLNIVESLYFDGMEFDGIFLLSRDFYSHYDGTVLNDMVDIGVHETAHQWWFGSVGNDQAMEPWLDEALSTYSERLFYEANYPAVTAWETFRITRFHPSGWVDTDVYHGGNFRFYANAVYLRGAQFLQDLRKLIGEDAFYLFLKDYALQMAGKISTADDFFRILRLHTDKDLSPLLAEYFQTAE